MANNEFKEAFDALNSFKSSLASLPISAFPERLQPLAENAKAKIESVLWNLGVALEKYVTDESKLADISADLLAKIQRNSLFEDLSREEQEEFAKLALQSGRGVPDREEFTLFVQKELRELDAEQLLAEAYTPQDIEAVGMSVTKSEPQAYPRGKTILLEILQTPMGRDEAIVKAMGTALEDPDTRHRYLKDFFGGAPDAQ